MPNSTITSKSNITYNGSIELYQNSMNEILDQFTNKQKILYRRYIFNTDNLTGDNDYRDYIEYEIYANVQIDSQTKDVIDSGYINNSFGNVYLPDIIKDVVNAYSKTDISNLSGWWKGDNNVKDSSDNINNGYWVGNASYKEGKQFKNAFNFNTYNYVVLDDDELTKDSGSIGFWIKITQSEQYAGIIQFGDSTPAFYIDQGVLGVVWKGATGLPIENEYFTEYPIQTNEWTYIMLNWENNSEISLYINNKLIETASNPVLSDITFTPPSDRNYTFVGQIGDIRTYSNMKNNDERNALYNNGEGLVDNKVRVLLDNKKIGTFRIQTKDEIFYDNKWYVIENLQYRYLSTNSVGCECLVKQISVTSENPREVDY